jgi:hypothetical protein
MKKEYRFMINPELHKKFKVLCAEKEVSMSEELEAIIMQAIARIS